MLTTIKDATVVEVDTSPTALPSFPSVCVCCQESTSATEGKDCIWTRGGGSTYDHWSGDTTHHGSDLFQVHLKIPLCNECKVHHQTYAKTVKVRIALAIVGGVATAALVFMALSALLPMEGDLDWLWTILAIAASLFSFVISGIALYFVAEFGGWPQTQGVKPTCAGPGMTHAFDEELDVTDHDGKTVQSIKLSLAFAHEAQAVAFEESNLNMRTIRGEKSNPNAS